ncbi:hypothetical protein LWI29_022532 [Acer saccharum]|uniref:non-specific serine/threonine protein kinase n=1 Tax=Acer saccharum TaxID=4024 RepID=A0AA39T4V9_ACESA|nr:hypothetical protein LWI29_022532 [Acer saccharum]
MATAHSLESLRLWEVLVLTLMITLSLALAQDENGHFIFTAAPYYVELFKGYGDVIDYVNHQFYTDRVKTLRGYLEAFKLRANQFNKEKLLPNYEINGRGIQGDAFFDALKMLEANGLVVNGVMIFSADDSASNGFYFERKSQRISYKSLYEATKGFKDKEVIGQGGFGKVYKGVLPSSNERIAIKRVTHDSGQRMKQFVAEIVSMGRLRHRNLVQLRGYCRRKGELMLVYDYMLNGSLDKILYGNMRPNLNWFQRIRIVRGVTCGLLYLHEEWEQVVLHRDIKPANILLDADLNGRLGDFGLAKLHDHGSNPQTTYLVGTIGYLAPELTKTGKATTGTDVFAFGAFMLEVACGRRPMVPGERVASTLHLYEEWEQVVLHRC